MEKETVANPLRHRDSIELHINRIRRASSSFQQEPSSNSQPKTDNTIPVKSRLSRKQSRSEENRINRTEISKEQSASISQQKTENAVPVKSRKQSSTEEKPISRIPTANSNQLSDPEKSDNSVNPRLSIRQSISEAKHIERMLRANSRRQRSVSGGKHVKMSPLKYLYESEEDLDSSKENRKEIASTSEFSSIKDARLNEATVMPLQSKLSLDSAKGKRRKSSISQRNQSWKSRKTSTAKRRKASSRKPSIKLIKRKKKINEPIIEKERLASPKKEPIVEKERLASPKKELIVEKERPASPKDEPSIKDKIRVDVSEESNKSDSGKTLKQKASKKENLKSKTPSISKEDIILKWVQGHNSPLSASVSSEINRSPIQILKKPVQSSTNNIGELPEVQNFERDSTEIIAEKVPDVEMYVSELGKLQIIMNAKLIQPEDAAIIIWVDEIPREFLVPQYHKRLSLANLPSDLKPSEMFTKTARKKEEEIKILKGNTYFPYVSILEAAVVDSRTGLVEKMSED